MIYTGDALEYIKDTPEILLKILRNQDEIFKDCVRCLKETYISRVYLTGLGSSYFAAKAAYKYMEDILGVQVIPVRPQELYGLKRFMDKGTVILGISQQGTSTGVISVLDELRTEGHRVIALCGEHNTEITYHGDATLYIECGYEDAGATTKGFTATILTLELFAVQIALCKGTIKKEEKESYIIRLSEEFINLGRVLKDSFDTCNRISDLLITSRDLIIIAGDRYENILQEIVLKFTETSRFPVRGFHTEEFMHGIYNAVNEDTDFLFIWDDSPYVRKIYDYYEKRGNRLFCINRETNNTVYDVILPLQQLIVMASRKRRIDLNIPKDPGFHKIMGSKLEK